MPVNIVGQVSKSLETSGFAPSPAQPASGAKLSRQQVADALTSAGFPISRKTLENMAWRGDGPPFSKFGRRAIYQWSSALAWANGRLR
jgi:hypothetical protein